MAFSTPCFTHAVPFRKGDPVGSRWIDNEPLFIDWSKASVDWLSTASEARWQGHTFFLSPGVCWSCSSWWVQALATHTDALTVATQVHQVTYLRLLEQARLWAFVDNFRLFGLLSLLCLPLIFLLKSAPSHAQSRTDAH